MTEGATPDQILREIRALNKRLGDNQHPLTGEEVAGLRDMLEYKNDFLSSAEFARAQRQVLNKYKSKVMAASAAVAFGWAFFQNYTEIAEKVGLW